MSARKARGLIRGLEVLTLLVLAACHSRLPALLLSSALLLASLFILYQNLGVLTDVSEDSPKLKTVRKVTVFDAMILLACVAWAVLTRLGVWNVTELGEVRFAAFLFAAVMIFGGIISPKLPFSRHTGLRLPWTVMDEETWIVAHRILGYVSLPLALFYLAAVSTLRSAKGAEILSLTVAALWIGIPGVLSLLFYQRKMKGKL